MNSFNIFQYVAVSKWQYNNKVHVIRHRLIHRIFLIRWTTDRRCGVAWWLYVCEYHFILGKMNERAVFIYVYNISKCTHRIRSMKRERYRFEIVMFVIVCYINIFDIHTMRVRQPSTVLPMNIYAFQIKSHRRFIFSFTPLFGQFGWSALLTLNLYAVCVRFAWFYLTVAKWKILYQLDWFVFCILYHVWKTNDAHIFHTGIFFPFILQLYISSWKLVCGLLIFETCAPFDVSQFDGFGCSIGVVLCSARVQMLGIIIQHQQM